MLMITALIRPFRLDHVCEELVSADIQGLTVTECVGHGKEAECAMGRHVDVYLPNMMPTLKIELTVRPENVERALDAIRRGARLDRADGGKVFVSNLEAVVSIGPRSDDIDAPVRSGAASRGARSIGSHDATAIR